MFEEPVEEQQHLVNDTRNTSDVETVNSFVNTDARNVAVGSEKQQAFLASKTQHRQGIRVSEFPGTHVRVNNTSATVSTRAQRPGG